MTDFYSFFKISSHNIVKATYEHATRLKHIWQH